MLTAASEGSNSTAILERLLKLHPKKIDLVLDRIERLLAELGNPQDQLPPVIHVAGTNGKGSVTSFLRSMFTKAGYRVNAYTSPHLVRFHERIWLAGEAGEDGAPIADDLLDKILGECEAANGAEPITFFEITTAAALLAFSRNPADITVLEVGLGGTYDATNVIGHKALSIITPIDYDHQDFLGTTLQSIAKEKAGILAPDVPAVVGKQSAEALSVIEERAAEVGAPLIVQDRDFTAYEEHGRLAYQDMSGLLDLPLPRLKGRHQIDNAALAVATTRTLDALDVTARSIAQGLRHAHWPGRLQQLDPESLVDFRWLGELPEIWLDGGHNPAAARVVAQAMAELEERVSRPLYLIVAMMDSKDAEQFLSEFQTLARRVIVLPLPNQENGMSTETLLTAAEKAGLQSEKAEDLSSAFNAILLNTESVDGEGESPRILICGSLYLAGHVLSRCRTAD